MTPISAKTDGLPVRGGRLFFCCGGKTEMAVFATFPDIFQKIPRMTFGEMTKSPETIVVSGLLTMVRGTGLEPVTPCTSSMCSTS